MRETIRPWRFVRSTRALGKPKLRRARRLMLQRLEPRDLLAVYTWDPQGAIGWYENVPDWNIGGVPAQTTPGAQDATEFPNGKDIMICDLALNPVDVTNDSAEFVSQTTTVDLITNFAGTPGLDDSTWTLAHIYVADTANNNATVSIEGGDGQVTSVTTQLGVGAGNEGTLSMHSGNLNSGVTEVGGSGTGNLDIVAQVNPRAPGLTPRPYVQASTLSLGVQPMASGNLLVSGNGASAHVENDSAAEFPFRIGDSGIGWVMVKDGGMLSNSGVATIGHAAGAEGEVHVESSGVWSPDEVIVGRLGVGSIVIEQTGTLNVATNMTVASDVGSTGTVRNRGDWTVSGSLIVGPGGVGLVELLGGGRLTTEANSVVGGGAGTGTVRLKDNADWHAEDAGVRKNIMVGGGAGTGAIELDPNSTMTVDTLHVNMNGTFSGDQNQVTGNVKPAGGGKVKPGANGGGAIIGTINIVGNYDDTGGGILFAEIAGAGSNDLISLTGTASLGGTLKVPAIGNPVFASGQRYVVLEAANVNGQFGNLPADPVGNGDYARLYVNHPDLPALPAGLAWEVRYDDVDGDLVPDEVALTVVQIPVVTIVANDANASEQGTDPGQFTITRVGYTGNALTVAYLVSGQAINGNDYQQISSSVVIPVGSSNAIVDIVPIDDTMAEPTEDVKLTLTSGANYTVGTPSNATVTIADNEPIVSIVANDAAASEQGPDSGQFTVSRTGPTTSALIVGISISGTAINGTDYTTISTSVTIGAGSSSATINVNPYVDSLSEGSETVIATVSSSGNYHVGTPSSDTVTIADLPTVTLSVSDSSASETGPNNGQFLVTRTGSTATALTVTFTIATGMGMATNGADYSSISTSIVIPAGSASAPININVIDDAVMEMMETVSLTLSASSSYNRGTPYSNSLMIQDNDFHLRLAEPAAGGDAPAVDPLALADVRAMLALAADHWVAAGADAAALATKLENVVLRVEDLPDNAIGAHVSGELWFDVNAAGYGWFIDATPDENGEFTVVTADGELRATAGSPAAGHVDLLTVMEHEVGHLLGFDDLAANLFDHDLMTETLGLGDRRTPLAGQGDEVNAIRFFLFRDDDGEYRLTLGPSEAWQGDAPADLVWNSGLISTRSQGRPRRETPLEGSAVDAALADLLGLPIELVESRDAAVDEYFYNLGQPLGGP